MAEQENYEIQSTCLSSVCCNEIRWAIYGHKISGHRTVRVSRSVSKRQIQNSPHQAEKGIAQITFPDRVPRQLVVILLPQVCDHLLAHHPAQSVLELHQLNEQIMLGIQIQC